MERMNEMYNEKKYTNVISLIAEVLGTDKDAIKDVTVLDKGMTNDSFRFRFEGRHCIIRIPGAGTEKIIDRGQEYEVYKSLIGRGFSESVIYLNPKTGCKITEFWQEARVCDAAMPGDVGKCMRRLRDVHESKISVNHIFDLFERIEHYEKLRSGEASIFGDYTDTKDKVYELKHYIDAQPKKSVLSHIDAISDNFLLIGDDVKMIDWEYAGMHDPHVDIAMFAIYSLYDREELDKLIDLYFMDGCGTAVRIKIYCYVAACGLLWSNWCEYKRLCGVDVGEYSIRQYGYARDYYKIAKDAML